ncbi:GNAT family N-acetyltransferase [Rhizobium deserti]|uniref:GNAT family N-acetyltransferase n=1 Tax=Rhizobium deserti TaxID=2547961 RepID=A0A4R5UFR3_9HYPH|nr:GNAT family N-acetyltransferase [Rhizobium deserti]TDK34343.1 GNAT family N-acetyltransferase [Rhizobium deserti]
MTVLPRIRSLTLDEVQVLLDWAEAEGWNPGLTDAAAFRAADPAGFIGCFVGDRMTAGISAVRYGSAFGFIGLYIAHPDFRGKGYGRMVWDAATAHLEGRTIGLDGVPEQQANYSKIGFEAAYETGRWSGTLAVPAPAEVQTANVDMLAALLAYEREAFPAERIAFLTEWLQPPRVAKVLIRNGRAEGYAVCRQCHYGWKIGPLFAATAADAELLLRACAAEAKQAPLQIDVPDMQRDFVERLQGLGFTKGFMTARMYRGRRPEAPMNRVFGITTLELG